MDAADYFVVEFDRRAVHALTGFGALLGTLGILLLVYAPELGREVGEPAWFLRAIGLVCVIFFGGWGMVAARHVFRFGPALVLDAEGIEDAASFARMGRIPWSEIAGFASARLTGNGLLVIRLRDPGRALRGAWPWMRLVHWASLRRYGSPVVVPELALQTSSKKLLATCRRFHKEAKERARLAVTDSTSKP